jgi:hypothetical protein
MQESNELYKDDLSEGEIVIEQYLIDEGLKYEAQVDIKNLKGDFGKTHRTADFYLKQFDVYVEFLGKWNAGEKFKADYKNKMKVYAANKIPCVYLWPENLGFLKQALNYRIEKELRKKKKNKHLIRFKIYKLNSDVTLFSMIFILTSSFLFLWFTQNSQDERILVIQLTIYLTLGFFSILSFIALLIGFIQFLLIILGYDDRLDKWFKNRNRLKRNISRSEVTP